MAHCGCFEVIMKRGRVRHYDEAQDRLGSEFDDFGTETYQDSQGNLHTRYRHHHLGLLESGSHSLNLEPLDKTWVLVKTESYKNDMEAIRKWLIESKTIDRVRQDEAEYLQKMQAKRAAKQKFFNETLCRYATRGKGCTREDCRFNHNPIEFYCPFEKMPKGCLYYGKGCKYSHRCDDEKESLYVYQG